MKVCLRDKSGSPITVSPGLLANLMCPDDDGCSSPNPTTFYLMRRQRMDTIPKAKAGVGSAYRWAQVYTQGNNSIEMGFFANGDGPPTSPGNLNHFCVSCQLQENLKQ